MSDNAPLLKINLPCNEAVDWVQDKMSLAGLSILRTFNLQVARQSQADCPCPHHSTDRCDCQMVVLLVYQAHRQPITIVAHGYNNQTVLSVVDTPQQRTEPGFEAIIRRSLRAQVLPAENFIHDRKVLDSS
jgi:hypothetical protein